MKPQGGIVGIWVTNHPKYLSFVQDKLLGAWGLEKVGVWCWVKVTSGGGEGGGVEPVVPFVLGKRHRKPYEILIIGKRKELMRAYEGLNEIAEGVDGKEGQDTEQKVEVKRKFEFPERRMLVSVPSRYHSRKPFLGPLLEPYLPTLEEGQERCRVEMFARNLLPGWTSWGNEVLKFNETAYFKERNVVIET
jgi:N6-adenosine-specific RNA methylase IME4